jgi:DNA-binding NtrC family response regulator
VAPVDLHLGRFADNDEIRPYSFPPSKPTSELDLEDPEFALALANNAMADIERVAILATLESTSGNKTEAARRLGLTARTLSNKMKIWRQAGLVA